MKVAVSGSTGFIGKHLTSYLENKGIEIVPLFRRYFISLDTDALDGALSGCDAVINLAGENINHRWTTKYKERILASRINTTHKLVEAINRMEVKPKSFISVSAVGIYPSECMHTEDTSGYGKKFLSQVCLQWENEAAKVSTEVRLIIPRFGVVLAHDGGALPKLLIPFRLFLGGRIASGSQGFSWIHIQDLLDAIYFLLINPDLSGVFNFTAPEVINNRKFAHVAAKELGRPDWLTLPAILFRLLYGEGHTLMTEGQRAYPKRLLKAGYQFKYDKLYLALQDLL